MGEPLFDTAREANRDLSFRQWNASKHGQYFTPLQISNAIYRSLIGALVWDDSDAIEQVHVLDPTAGNGRLLNKWKGAGANVLGVEFDSALAHRLKSTLGSDNVRHGDILEYRSYLKEKFNLVLTNPPYGIYWDAPQDLSLRGESGKVESQSAVIEVATEALREYGLMVTILPTSSMLLKHASDRALLTYLSRYYDLLGRITVEKAFQSEYKIDVDVDVCLWQRLRWNKQGHLKWNQHVAKGEDLDAPMRKLVAHAKERFSWCFPYFASNESTRVPDLERLLTPEIKNDIKIGADGISGDAAHRATLDFINEQVEEYNPAQGSFTGIVDAICSRPALITRGTDRAKKFLPFLGFKTTVEGEEKLKRLHKKFDRINTPINKDLIGPHNILSWYENREYQAQRTLHDDNGELLYRKGNSYLFKPQWVRHEEILDQEVVQKKIGGKSQEVTITTRVDRGYLLIEVISEQGPRDYRESEQKEIRELTSAFPVPDIEDVEDKYPSLVNHYRCKIAKLNRHLKENTTCTKCEGTGQVGERTCHICRGGGYYQLFDYQVEDAVRLATKQDSFLAYDMGGGKELMTAVMAYLKGSKRNIAIMPSSLVDNSYNQLINKFKLDEFGMVIEKLLTHEAISDFQQRVKRGEFRDKQYLGIVSQTFLSLDTGKVYEPWDCVKYRTKKGKDGEEVSEPVIYHNEVGNTGAKCRKCHRSFANAQPECLNLVWREPDGRTKPASRFQKRHADKFPELERCGSTRLTSTGICLDCGHIPFTYRGDEADGGQYFERASAPLLSGEALGQEHSGASLSSLSDQRETSTRQWPAYKRLRRMFTRKFCNEAHELKNTQSARGRASRAIHVKGRTLLTGTPIKSNVTCLYANLTDCTGFDNPIFPYPRRGAERSFLDCFATYTWVTEEYANNLSTGGRKMVPEVSNVNVLMRMMSGWTVRRTRDEMTALPPCYHVPVYLPMDSEWRDHYVSIEQPALQEMKKAIATLSPSAALGIISKTLWKLRFLSTIPISDHLDGHDRIENPDWENMKETWSKVQALEEIVSRSRARGEKTLIGSGLVEMQEYCHNYLQAQGYKGYYIPSSMSASGGKRLAVIDRAIEEDDCDYLISGINVIGKGFDICHGGFCNAVVTDLTWTPDEIEQFAARVIRSGQVFDVHMFYLISQASFDEAMHKTVTQKLESVNHAINGKPRYSDTAALLKSLSNSKSLKEQVALSLLNPSYTVEETHADDLFKSPPAGFRSSKTVSEDTLKEYVETYVDPEELNHVHTQLSLLDLVEKQLSEDLACA